MKPDEVYWMLLSFMTMPAEEQLHHLQNPIPLRDDLYVSFPTKNNLIALNLALSAYYLSWRDQMADDGSVFLDEFDSTRERLVATEPLSQDPGILCYEEFIAGSGWKELRRLAKMALEESGFGVYPVPSKICFNDFVELVDPDEAGQSSLAKMSTRNEGVRYVVSYHPDGSVRDESFFIDNEIALTRVYMGNGDVIERYFLGREEVSLGGYMKSLKLFSGMERPLSTKARKKLKR